MNESTDIEFEDQTGFQSGVRDEVDNFTAKLRAFAEEAKRTKVSVLFWGPGRHSGHHYAKRMQLVDHLKALSEFNEVETSEALEENSQELANVVVSAHDRELIHAAQADIIFVLLVSEAQVTGPQTEVAIIRPFKRLREKTWIIMPKKWERASFLAQGVADFPSERKKAYTFPQITDCQKIRSMCEEKVREVRSQKIMERMISDKLLSA